MFASAIQMPASPATSQPSRISSGLCCGGGGRRAADLPRPRDEAAAERRYGEAAGRPDLDPDPDVREPPDRVAAFRDPAAGADRPVPPACRVRLAPAPWRAALPDALLGARVAMMHTVATPAPYSRH